MSSATDGARNATIIGFSIGAALRTVILVMLGAVLYGGYKEQLAHEEEQESTQKPASKTAATVVIAGKQVQVVENNVDQENKLNAV